MTRELLEDLGIRPENRGAFGRGWHSTSGTKLVSCNPTTGEPIASIAQATGDDYEQVMQVAEQAFRSWRMMPAPQRGEIVRQLGEELRANKDRLGRLVSLEMGKILSEGLARSRR